MGTTDAVTEAVKFIQSAGFIGITVLIAIGGFRKWWVWGHQYEDMRKERDEWRALALRGTHITERAMVTASSILAVRDPSSP